MNKLSLPLRLVQTGPNRSSVSPGFFEIATDCRPDCGCSLFQSWEFRSFLAIVQSSPGLFPVPGLDLQTLDVGAVAGTILDNFTPSDDLMMGADVGDVDICDKASYIEPKVTAEPERREITLRST